MPSPILKTLSIQLISLTGLLTIIGCGVSNEAQPAKDTSALTKPDNNQLKIDRARDGALGDMTLGNPDSPVTLVEYASFTCSACAGFHKSIYPDLKEKYINTGKINFIFRELPTAPKEISMIGSLVARCAADLGGDAAFFAIGNGLFDKQREWAFGSSPKAALLKITNQAGMGQDDINQCLERQEILDVINTNIDEANTVYNISGTPSFLLNGEHIKIKNYQELFDKIDTALGQ